MPLRIADLSKRIGDKWVLRDVFLEISDGKVFGICGENGSGKTTLLDAAAAELLERGETAVLLPKRGSRFRDILSSEPKDGPGKLERDLRQAVDSTAKYILVDDAFMRFDPSRRTELAHLLRTWAERTGGAALLASNDFSTLVEAGVDHAAILSGGTLVQAAAPTELYDRPNSAAVARLTGPANIIPARRLTSSTSAFPEFFTRDGEHRIFAASADKQRLAPINKDAFLCIRPEQLVLTEGSSFPEDNLLKAVVKEVREMRPASSVVLDAGGLVLTASAFRVVGLSVGQECMVGLPPDRIVVLKE